MSSGCDAFPPRILHCRNTIERVELIFSLAEITFIDLTTARHKSRNMKTMQDSQMYVFGDVISLPLLRLIYIYREVRPQVHLVLSDRQFYSCESIHAAEGISLS